jgi:hypothetical protein
MRKILRLTLLTAVFVVSLMFFTGCEGPNSAFWRGAAGIREDTLNGKGFGINTERADSGTRNRTFNLTAEELSFIQIYSTSDEGEIILVISHGGNKDGSEITLDITNFYGEIDASSLEAGLIRFTFQFDEVRNSATMLRWR